jgi:hypothetical protein
VIAAAGIGYSIGTVISEMIQSAGEKVSEARVKKENELSTKGALAKEISGLDLSTEAGKKRAGEIQVQLEKEQTAARNRFKNASIKDDLTAFAAGGQLSGEAFLAQNNAILSLKELLRTQKSNEFQGRFMKELEEAARRTAKALAELGDAGGSSNPDYFNPPSTSRGPVTKPPPTPGASPKSSSGDYFR